MYLGEFICPFTGEDVDESDFPDEVGKSVCPCCNEVCDVIMVDLGFDYDYGSISSYHTQYTKVSSCCEEQIDD